EERIGGQVTIGRKLNDKWSASGRIRIEGVGIHDVPDYEPIDYQEVVGENFLLGLRGSVTRDTRDSYLRPTEGSLVEVSYEECLGSFTFPLFTADANKYFTIWQRADGSGRHVLAARTELGIAGSNTPVYERFFAGGFRSMRGFEFRGVGPQMNEFELGGDFLW